MSGVVRLLLIWFIAAAVPLKGLAAVTMGVVDWEAAAGGQLPRLKHTVTVASEVSAVM